MRRSAKRSPRCPRPCSQIQLSRSHYHARAWMWRVCWLTPRLPNVYTQPWMHLSVLSGCITPTISVARRSISESLCGRADTLLPAGPTGRAGADPDGAELRDEADSLVATGRELPDGQIPPRKRAA